MILPEKNDKRDNKIKNAAITTTIMTNWRAVVPQISYGPIKKTKVIASMEDPKHKFSTNEVLSPIKILFHLLCSSVHRCIASFTSDCEMVQVSGT